MITILQQYDTLISQTEVALAEMKHTRAMLVGTPASSGQVVVAPAHNVSQVDMINVAKIAGRKGRR